MSANQAADSIVRKRRLSVRGSAEFELDLDDESTVNTSLKCTYPLKLLVPGYASVNPGCKWLYIITYGGGLVEGDCIGLDVKVGENATVVLTTQASTKVYHCEEGLTTRQDIRAEVGDGGLLAVLPDHLVCFKDAIYEQEQVFDLTCESNIIVLDWLSAGRMACDEIWELKSCSCHSKVYVAGKLVYGDAIMLSQNLQVPLKESMKNIMVLGSCVFIGPYFKNMVQSIQGKVRSYNQQFRKSKKLTVSASSLKPLCDGIVVKLFSASSTEVALGFFSDIIADVVPRLGGNPLQKQ